MPTAPERPVGKFHPHDQEPLARKIAGIMGDGSAAAKALVEYDRMRKDGKPVIVFSLRGSWLIGDPDAVADAVSKAPRRGTMKARRTV